MIWWWVTKWQTAQIDFPLFPVVFHSSKGEGLDDPYWRPDSHNSHRDDHVVRWFANWFVGNGVPGIKKSLWIGSFPHSPIPPFPTIPAPDKNGEFNRRQVGDCTRRAAQCPDPEGARSQSNFKANHPMPHISSFDDQIPGVTWLFTNP